MSEVNNDKLILTNINLFLDQVPARELRAREKQKYRPRTLSNP